MAFISLILFFLLMMSKPHHKLRTCNKNPSHRIDGCISKRVAHEFPSSRWYRLHPYYVSEDQRKASEEIIGCSAYLFYRLWTQATSAHEGDLSRGRVGVGASCRGGELAWGELTWGRLVARASCPGGELSRPIPEYAAFCALHAWLLFSQDDLKRC